MEDVPNRVEVTPSLPQDTRTTTPGPEAAALGLTLTPEDIAQLTETVDPAILALLALC